MVNFEAVIGVEIHVQIKTKRKQFCGCPAVVTREIAEANKYICPICLGHPGVLPVLNRESVNKVLVLGARLGSQVSRRSIFARKNYFYPDLPKGYQITQYHTPLLLYGEVDYFFDGEIRKATLERAHLEEDTAKIFYLDDGVYLDYNRAGIPLLEIVTAPCFSSSREVVAFLDELRFILKALEISDANMEEGNFRCEPNISVRPAGSVELLTKTEIKNLNSFATLVKALDYEIERQTRIWQEGGRVEHTTLRWDEAESRTVPMRAKETQADYRYFDEPDLPPLVVSEEEIEKAHKFVSSRETTVLWKGNKVTFPPGRAKVISFLLSEVGLSLQDAEILASERYYLQLFMQVAEVSGDVRESVNWVLQEYRPKALQARASVPAEQIAEIIRLKKAKALTTAQARDVLAVALKSGKSVKQIVSELGYGVKISGEELENICKKVIDSNEKVVADILRGKVAAISVLVGGVMRETKGSADPLQVENELKRLLNL